MSSNDITSLEERYEPDNDGQTHEAIYTCSDPSTCFCPQPGGK